MKKIVIATDGSPSSVEAVGVGIELAAEQGAEVAFVHVLPADDYVVAARLGHLPKPHQVDMDESEVALREAADAAEAAGSRTRSSASRATRSTRSSPWRTPRTRT